MFLATSGQHTTAISINDSHPLINKSTIFVLLLAPFKSPQACKGVSCSLAAIEC